MRGEEKKRGHAQKLYIEVVGPPHAVRTVLCVETVSSLDLFVGRLGISRGRGFPLRADGLDFDRPCSTLGKDAPHHVVRQNLSGLSIDTGDNAKLNILTSSVRFGERWWSAQSADLLPFISF